MKATVSMLLLAAMTAALHVATARETTVAKTTCTVTEARAKPATSPCTATQTGGAGVSILTYTVGSRSYDYRQDDAGESFDEETVQTYIRDRKFRISDDDRKKAWFCYKTSKVELCSKQPSPPR